MTLISVNLYFLKFIIYLFILAILFATSIKFEFKRHSKFNSDWYKTLKANRHQSIKHNHWTSLLCFRFGVPAWQWPFHTSTIGLQWQLIPTLPWKWSRGRKRNSWIFWGFLQSLWQRASHTCVHWLLGPGSGSPHKRPTQDPRWRRNRTVHSKPGKATGR